MAEQRFHLAVLMDEPCDTALQYFQVLNNTHLALVISQGAKLPLAETGEGRGERFHHVAEAFERHPGLMNGFAGQPG